MATFQDVLNSVAAVVGGTVTSDNPYFFSGLAAGDSTGLQAPAGLDAFQGCYSILPDKLAKTPVGIIEYDSFAAQLGVQGFEDNVDLLYLWLLIGKKDEIKSMAQVLPYRDLVPAAFRAKMNAGRQATNDNTQIASVFVRAGHMRTIEWAALQYVGWRFELEVQRYENPGYSIG